MITTRYSKTGEQGAKHTACTECLLFYCALVYEVRYDSDGISNEYNTR